MGTSKSINHPKQSESVKPQPEIIIAATDPVSRARMVRALAEKTRVVETTGSAACLMEALLHGGSFIVILGDGLEEGLSVPQLVNLLKSCNPRATIILAAEDVSPAEEIKVSQQGVFYRTTRPVSALGQEELQQAVECACNKALVATRPVQVH